MRAGVGAYWAYGPEGPAYTQTPMMRRTAGLHTRVMRERVRRTRPCVRDSEDFSYGKDLLLRTYSSGPFGPSEPKSEATAWRAPLFPDAFQ